MDRLLSFLGIIRKSGNVIMGFDKIRDAIKERKISLILATEDFSEKRLNGIFKEAENTGITIKKINYSMDSIDKVLGKYSGIMGIKDIKCAKKIIDLIYADGEGGM